MEAEGLVLPLDVNFPEPILKIDPALTRLDDRDLALALRQEG